MGKKIILSVAGSGKTTFVVNCLDLTKRYIVLTYTNANYDNLRKKIITKFDGVIPKNIFIYNFDYFLYNILFKGIYADLFPEIKGIEFDQNKINSYAKQGTDDYWKNKYMIYSARLSYYLLQNKSALLERIEAITDYLIIDEVQDVGSRDFDLIMTLSKSTINLLYVGDFYQHTYQTSADHNYRKSLFYNYSDYIKELKKYGFEVELDILNNSYRCSKSVCEFVKNKLRIPISSHRNDETDIAEIADIETIKDVWYNNDIVKLHYQKASEYSGNHRNWGDVKGEDKFNDVCIILNKNTYDHFKNNCLSDLNPITKAKLYVAITRAKGKVFLVNCLEIEKIIKT